MNDALEKFENHPSVHKIRKTFLNDGKCSLQFVNADLVRKEIMNLDGSKVTPNDDIRQYPSILWQIHQDSTYILDLLLTSPFPT